MQFVTEESFNEAGEAGDKDLQASEAFQWAQSVHADDIWTERYFLVLFLSGAKWFSTINKAENQVESCQGLYSFRVKGSQKFSTELGYFSVKKNPNTQNNKQS